jgi:hypothetical protein
MGNVFLHLQGRLQDKREETMRRGTKFVPPTKEQRDSLTSEIIKRQGPPQARLVKRSGNPAKMLQIAIGALYVKPLPLEPERVLNTQSLRCAEPLPGRCFRCNKPLPEDGEYEARHYGLFCDQGCADEANPYAMVEPKRAKGADSV